MLLEIAGSLVAFKRVIVISHHASMRQQSALRVTHLHRSNFEAKVDTFPDRD